MNLILTNEQFILTEGIVDEDYEDPVLKRETAEAEQVSHRASSITIAITLSRLFVFSYLAKSVSEHDYTRVTSKVAPRYDPSRDF